MNKGHYGTHKNLSPLLRTARSEEVAGKSDISSCVPKLSQLPEADASGKACFYMAAELSARGVVTYLFLLLNNDAEISSHSAVKEPFAVAFPARLYQ